MRLTTFLILLSFVQVSASSLAQQVTLREKNSTLEKIFKQIRQQTGYDFFYDRSQVKIAKAIDITVQNASLRETLNLCFADLALTYVINNNTVIVKRKINVPLPTRDTLLTVGGRILNENLRPINGATVHIKGSDQRSATEPDGAFLLTGVTPRATLVVSYMGYRTTERQVTPQMGDIVLQVAPYDLQEVDVVSTGFQKIPAERATGSFTLIGKKQFEHKIQTNLIERLEGIAPGLLLINGKDDGSSNALTIRGVSSLTGTTRPLIVVDNFPITGDINSINPNDVESITLLKDAAAASIWGAQAANGVIVITMKNAKNGKLQFNYNSNFQFQPKPDLSYVGRLNATQDIAVEKYLMRDFDDWIASSYLSAPMQTTYSKFEGLYLNQLAGNITEDQYNQGVNALKQLDNTKQIKELLMQHPTTQNHTLAFQGGDQANNYYGSLQYVRHAGYQKGKKNDNVNFFLKDNFKVSDKLSFGISNNLTISGARAANVDPLDVYQQVKPYELLVDQNGLSNFVNYTVGPAVIDQNTTLGLQHAGYNPVKELDLTKNSSDGFYNRLQANMKYNITNGLSFSLYYQLEHENSKNQIYTAPGQYGLSNMINYFAFPQLDGSGNVLYNTNGTLANPIYNIPLGGRLVESNGVRRAYNLRALFDFDKAIAENHRISAVLGGERSQNSFNGSHFTRYGYDDKTLLWTSINAADMSQKINGPYRVGNNPYNDMTDNNSSSITNRYIAAFANMAYVYKQKYVLSGSARMDATNLFGTDPKNVYKPFGSVGLSWILSNEDFLQTSWVNQLQLRATYGVNGNVPKASGPFDIAQSGRNVYTNNPSLTVVTPANYNLTWERTNVYNIGLDYTLFSNRITGKVDWYLKKSRDLLSDQQINPTLGFTKALLNDGALTNHGIETQLVTHNIKNSNFTWTSSFMMAYNRNKITKLGVNLGDVNAFTRVRNGFHVNGYPFAPLFSYRYGGLKADNGQPIILDANGTPMVADEGYANLEYSGNTRPVWNGSLGNTFQYRNLELSFMFIFYGDYYQRQKLTQPTSFSSAAIAPEYSQFWQQAGDEKIAGMMPSVDFLFEEVLTSQRFPYANVNVFNSSYAKLREIIFTYRLSNDYLRGFKYINNIQFNLQARNLLTISKNKLGIDPEAFLSSRTLPVSPTFATGINFNF